MAEELYSCTPIIHAFKCELCNDGEQKLDREMCDKNNDEVVNTKLIYHKCDKCNGTMRLPKMYPWVDYLKGELINNDTT